MKKHEKGAGHQLARLLEVSLADANARGAVSEMVLGITEADYKRNRAAVKDLMRILIL